jgi:hypothetical protein
MKKYESEIGTFFPSAEPSSVQDLATLRGAAAGTKAAEAFNLLREIDK